MSAYDGSEELVHPAPLLLRTPPIFASTQSGRRASLRPTLPNTEREIRAGRDLGSASAIGDPIAAVGLLLAQSNSWRMHVPAGSTKLAVEPFALGRLEQQGVSMPYEGGRSMQLSGSGALALLGLGIADLVQKAAGPE